MSEKEHSEAIIGDKFVRRFRLEKVCHEGSGHRHNCDHETRAVQGRIRITKRYERDGVEFDGEPIELEPKSEEEPSDPVLIEAGVFHTVKALTPNVIYECVFSHRDFEGQIVQTYCGNVQAYQ